MFQRDFVTLGENQTRNFVARHKLGFNATSSLCLGIELVGARVRVRVRVRIPRQIRYSSGTDPPQTCHKIRHRSATDLPQNPPQIPPQIRHRSGAIARRLSSYTTNNKTKFVYTDLNPTFSSARNRIIKDNKLRNLIQHCNNILQSPVSISFDLIRYI